MAAIYQWVLANWGMIASVLWGISEALALIPGVKANSVFQAIYNFLAGIVAKPSA